MVTVRANDELAAFKERVHIRALQELETTKEEWKAYLCEAMRAEIRAA